MESVLFAITGAVGRVLGGLGRSQDFGMRLLLLGDRIFLVDLLLCDSARNRYEIELRGIINGECGVLLHLSQCGFALLLLLLRCHNFSFYCHDSTAVFLFSVALDCNLSF